MQISFFIAKRYVKKHGHTRLIYRLSRLACYTMALGTASLVLILSTMNGMEKLLASLFYAYTPALKIEPKIGKTFVYDPTLKDKLMHISGITTIVEVLEATALVGLQRQRTIVTIKGVSSNFPASDFYRNCSRMDAVTLGDGGPAIAGIGVAHSLRWAPFNNRLEVFYPKQGGYHLNRSYNRRTLSVDGLFSIARQIDSKYIIAPIHFVEALTGDFHRRTSWEVVLKEEAELGRIQANIQKVLPDGYKATHRDQQNETRRRAIFIERLSVSFVFVLVLLLASLHIFFMQCMCLLHKQKDIALLASLGATPVQTGKVIFYNGLLIALEGMAYGMIMGWGLGFLQQKFGSITFTRAGRCTPYPIEMHGFDFLYITIVTAIFSLLASLWPVKRAMQLAKKPLVQPSSSHTYKKKR